MNLIKMKTIGVLIFVLVLVVSAVLIHRWTSEAQENYEDAMTKAESDRWSEEVEARGTYGGYIILGLTFGVAAVFASGIFERFADDEEDEEEEEDEPAEAASPAPEG